MTTMRVGVLGGWYKRTRRGALTREERDLLPNAAEKLAAKLGLPAPNRPIPIAVGIGEPLTRLQKERLRRRLWAIPAVRSLAIGKRKLLLKVIADALQWWWCEAKPMWSWAEVPRHVQLLGRKPNVGDRRFLIACVDAWKLVAGKCQAPSAAEIEGRARSGGVTSAKPYLNITANIADTAWRACGHAVPHSKWAGLCDNVRSDLALRAKAKNNSPN
ncbi:MAG: hypothetical protein ACK4UL_02675 [Novosphingobium meiothermophilum]|uniref:hypothetical protein n=1 Tax=Novosphingobium TaxID=165696 RepID=UPI0011AB37CD|nr:MULTISPECIES: hypothetical protein [Novosphingobium]